MGAQVQAGRHVETGRTSGPAPTVLVIGAAALMAFTMLAVFVGRGEGVGMTVMPSGTPVARLEFQAEDQIDGSIALRDVADRRVVAWIRPGEDGFLRGTLRGLAQARQRSGQGPGQPFSLTRFADGRLALADEATGREVPLEVFGPTNAQAFARLMPAGPAQEAR